MSRSSSSSVRARRSRRRSDSGLSGGCEMRQQVFASSTVTPNPAREVLDQPDVVMDSPKRQSLSSEHRQRGLQAGKRQIVQVLRFGQRHQLDHPGITFVGVSLGHALAELKRFPVCKVFRQGPGLMKAVRVGLGVDDAAAAQLCIGFQLAGQGLGRGLVGTTLCGSPHAVLIGVGDVPAGIGALAVLGFS